ncbi:hypothetical protein Smp_124720 [Schistosoma mansoni]|uniref:hypothetical protein n=1 Tax=Schistosoma mansoni TaxID=6183 RepID=UPI00022DBF83|nr:hypothetical protein Smp_124720 [Schistosoma mansoni]|eukprot:XP_018650456.1 hypothetical protein Smp_124720 [Schistosoma mansoni]
MDSLYTNEIGFIKLNKTCILWIVLLICSKFIHLSYIGCNAFQSHLIYWDPDNIIFQTKPVPLLRVKPKDEIIFVCAQESIYILWTYEFKVFESCSMWLNDNLMVNLLLKCPDKSNRKLQMRRQSTTNIPKDKLNLKTPQNLVIKNYSSLIGNSSTVQNNYHPSQFTLLVEEFAWANGNPSFPVNRPVYFLAGAGLRRRLLSGVYGRHQRHVTGAGLRRRLLSGVYGRHQRHVTQPSVCHSRNMRLGIVNGDFTGLLSDPYVNRFQAFWFTNNSGLIPSLKRNSSFLSNSDLNNYDQSIQKNIIPKNKHSLCSTTSTSLSSSVSLSIVNGYFIIPIIIFYICLN